MGMDDHLGSTVQQFNHGGLSCSSYSGDQFALPRQTEEGGLGARSVKLVEWAYFDSDIEVDS